MGFAAIAGGGLNLNQQVENLRKSGKFSEEQIKSWLDKKMSEQAQGPREAPPTDWGRVGSEMLGGGVGGAIGTAVTANPVTGAAAPYVIPTAIGLGSSMGGQAYDLY